MRKAQPQGKRPFPMQDVKTQVIPAPTDGWDAISPLALMDPKRAAILDNWVPRPGWVELRGGTQAYVQQVGGSTSPVETLVIWRGPTSQSMLAISGGSIYNITNASAVTTLAAGLANSRWQYVQMTPAGGSTVTQMVNGANTLRQFDGTSLTTPSITGMSGGRTTASFAQMWVQKRRLWYIYKNSTIAAFMPTDAISGAIAGELDLGALFTRGGYLVAMGDWTIDGGSGPNDYAAFVSSRGQVAIYAGTDPTSANTWSLNGVFQISPPIGTRCLTEVGSDLGIITLQGVLPISQALPFDPSADRSVAITSRIQNAMASAALSSAANFGWELTSFPAQQLAILNVPLTENQQQVQFVMNALTGAWCRFTGWNANTFAIFNDLLYFGDNSGNVFQAYVGATDFGVPIAFDMQCAYNYFDDPGRLKRMTAIQPLVVADNTVTLTLSVDEDFQTDTSTAQVTFATGGSLWDVALWDAGVWSLGGQAFVNWDSAVGLGHALAVRVKLKLGSMPDIAQSEFDTATFDTATFDASSGAQIILQINAFNTVVEMGGFI